MAYYIADEPDGAGFGMDPEILEEVYAYIKSQDPYHPVTLVLNCVTSAPRYVHCAGSFERNQRFSSTRTKTKFDFTCMQILSW